MELEIIGYRDVVVGEEITQEPIYNQPVIIIGSGSSAVTVSLEQYELDQAQATAEFISKQSNEQQ